MKHARLLLVMFLAGSGWSCLPSQAAESTSKPVVVAAPDCNPVCGAGQFCFRGAACLDKLPKDRPCDANEDCISNSCPVIEGSCISRTSGFNVACTDDGPCTKKYGHGCDLPQKTCK
jgi:hypothetical protein